MSPLTSALRRLDPVSLTELNEAAALMSRVDRKYLLTIADAEMLVATMPGGARALEIEGRRAFGYASLYLDTPALDTYRQAAHRRRRRAKVRTRRYLDSGGAFLEVKTREGRRSVKSRIAWSGHQLDARGRDFVRTTLAAASLDALDVDALAPALWTSYRRSTLLLDAEGVRVTVDTSLAWAHPVDEEIRLARPGLAIVETKSAGGTSSVDRLLWSLGRRPVTISKYATGLAALDPSLPSNRWQRLLDHHINPDPRPLAA